MKLVYYKDTGKYYSEGEMDLPYLIPEPIRPVTFYEAISYIREMLNRGERPGLVNGFDFHVHATVYTEYGPLTHLFIRRKEGDPVL